MIWLFAPEGGPPIKAAAYFFGALSELRAVATNALRGQDQRRAAGLGVPFAQCDRCVRRIGNRGS